MKGLKAIFCLAFFVHSNLQAEAYFGSPSIFRRQADQASGKCFESSPDDVEIQEENIVDIFKQDSVKKCFQKLNIGGDIMKAVITSNDTDLIGQAFDTETTKFCPTWQTSKTCIFDYLKNNCNEKEIQKIQDSPAFYYRYLAYPVLLCETHWDYLSRFFLQNWKLVGLSDCFSKPEGLGKFLECAGNKKKTHVESGRLPPFKQTLKEYVACAYPALNTCAGGDEAAELKMKVLLNLIDDAMESSYDMFWNDFKKQ